MLYECIKRSGRSVREFARQAKTHEPGLSEIRRGIRPAPLVKVEKWADMLGLTGAERERFLDLAAYTHAPERLKVLVRDLERNSGRTTRELMVEFRKPRR